MAKPERVYLYDIDLDGVVWHDGAPMEDETLLQLFMEKMERMPDGRVRALCMGETCLLRAEDCHYVIQSIEVHSDRVELVFPGDYRERLDPATLVVGEKNVLYCQVRGGEFRARFNRKTYLELAKKVKFDPKKGYLLPLGGVDYPIQGVVSR